MTTRAAIYSLLTGDIVLSAAPYNLTVDRIWSNFALDVAPRDGYFLIISWGSWTKAFADIGKQQLTVFGYIARELTTDYRDLTVMLERIEQIIVDSPGTVTGRSGDGVNETYDCLEKSSTIDVVTRQEI